MKEIKLQEFKDLPENDPNVNLIGEKYRRAGSAENVKVGDHVFYFEVIKITHRGYEAVLRDARIV